MNARFRKEAACTNPKYVTHIKASAIVHYVTNAVAVVNYDTMQKANGALDDVRMHPSPAPILGLQCRVQLLPAHGYHDDCLTIARLHDCPSRRDTPRHLRTRDDRDPRTDQLIQPQIVRMSIVNHYSHTGMATHSHRGEGGHFR